MKWLTRAAGLLLAISIGATEVSTQRVPDGGIQPQVMVDAKGGVHLIYFKGDPAKGDLFYVKSSDSGATFSPALRVNSVPGSAIAVGNIRGAHLALGKNGRVHVAWMGSGTATPRGPNKETPMLYARLNDAGSAFEEQRNVIAANYGLDGGGTVASDGAGNVFVFWHGQGGVDVRGEENRRVWVAHSADEGKTFAAETAASKDPTGVCACCGMSAYSDSRGNVFALYRVATGKTERGMSLLASKDKGASYAGTKLDSWTFNTCPMSSSVFSEGAGGVITAWENNGQVYVAALNSTLTPAAPMAAPGNAKGRKHPAVAVNANGEILLAWTEGMGWQKGGSLSWQLFDKDGKPGTQKGSAMGVPMWSLVAAFTRADGGFTILY